MALSSETLDEQPFNFTVVVGGTPYHGDYRDGHCLASATPDGYTIQHRDHRLEDAFRPIREYAALPTRTFSGDEGACPSSQIHIRYYSYKAPRRPGMAYEIIRIASANSLLDPKELSTNICDVVRAGSYFYALVPLDDYEFQELGDDTLEVLSLWPDNRELSNGEISEFAQAVASITYCKPSNIVEVYRKAVTDLNIDEDVKRFIGVNRSILLNLFQQVKKDIQSVYMSLKNEDFASIAPSLFEERVAVDKNIKAELNGLEYNLSQIYSAVSDLENRNPNLQKISKLGDEIANIKASLWRLNQQIDAIEVLENPYNAFESLRVQRQSLLDCMAKFNRRLDNAIKRHTDSIFGFQTMNWRPSFTQSLLILNVMLLWLEPTAKFGITTAIDRVIERFKDHPVTEDPDEDGGWDSIASFIMDWCPTRATSSDLRGQLEYLIWQLGRLTGNPHEGTKTSKQTPFMTNWLLLCAYSHVFAVVPEKSQFEDFSHFKEEKVLEDICFLLQESSLFPDDFTEKVLEQGINHLEFLLQDPGEPTGTTSQELTVR
ncbi:hypothetical protein FQN54_009328 [Arachnomyces sp. PD_36]|nr:hypothetical protein FQN54_009328 [Arachnomyces sp. PD_36]